MFKNAFTLIELIVVIAIIGVDESNGNLLTPFDYAKLLL